MKATITSKGQVTIPKPVRDFLNIGKSDQIDFIISESGKVIIEVTQTGIVQHAGMLARYKPDNPLSVEQMDALIQSGLADQVKP